MSLLKKLPSNTRFQDQDLVSFVNSSTRITSFLHNNLAREIQDSIKSKGKKRQTEERNLLIDEMRVEIERLGAQNKSLISN